MKCEICGREFSRFVKSCPFCRSERAESEALESVEVSHSTLSAPDPKPKLCEKCGEYYKADVERCPYCLEEKQTFLDLQVTLPVKKVIYYVVILTIALGVGIPLVIFNEGARFLALAILIIASVLGLYQLITYLLNLVPYSFRFLVIGFIGIIICALGTWYLIASLPTAVSEYNTGDIIFISIVGGIMAIGGLVVILVSLIFFSRFNKEEKSHELAMAKFNIKKNKEFERYWPNHPYKTAMICIILILIPVSGVITFFELVNYRKVEARKDNIRLISTLISREEEFLAKCSVKYGFYDFKNDSYYDFVVFIPISFSERVSALREPLNTMVHYVPPDNYSDFSDDDIGVDDQELEPVLVPFVKATEALIWLQETACEYGGLITTDDESEVMFVFDDVTNYEDSAKSALMELEGKYNI